MKKTRTLLLALSLGLGMNAYAEESNWIIKFNSGAPGAEDEYIYSEVDFHDFVVEGENMGTITFNPNLAGISYTVTDKFVLEGKNFTIDTSGAHISFAMPMANYDTNFTLKGGEGGTGSITTLGDAAFKSVTVESGTLYVGTSSGESDTLSQIGVTDSFTVKSGAKLEITKGGKMLLTDQIHNEGEVTINGVIDASNLTQVAAETIGVIFEDIEGNFGENVKNGFLHGGTKEDGTTPVVWNVTDGGTTTAATGEGGAYVLVATEKLFLNSDGQVEMTTTNKNLWFQNDGTLESVVAVTQKGGSKVAFIVNTNTQEGTTKLNVDGSLSTTNVVYSVRGSNVMLDLYPTGYPGGVGNLTVLDGANVKISPASGANGQISTLKFIGQSCALQVDGTAPEWWPVIERELSPINLVVETASSATVSAQMIPYWGYVERRNTVIGAEPIFGIVNLKGDLTLDGKSLMDLRTATSSMDNAQFVQGVGIATDVDYQEEFAHLYIAAGAALQLDTEATFLASTVADGASILTDSETQARNLDTSRHFDSVNLVNSKLPSYEEALAQKSQEKPYEVNGMVEIGSLLGGMASITSDGDIAGHYTTRNYNFTVSAAELTVTDDSYSGTSKDTTISNVLIGDSVTNAKANHGKVTLDNAANANFNTLYAYKGDIDITNKESVDADTVHLAAARTVSVTELETATKLNVSNVLQGEGDSVNGYSKIDADLNLAVGVTLDVSAANGTGGIDMKGNNVTFAVDWTGEKAMTLSNGDYDQLWALEPGGMYDLFHDVAAFDFGWGGPSSQELTVDQQLDASQYFTNLEQGCFYLCYTGVQQSGDRSNVGTIYLYSMVPEPTTGTLSLLALAALAARRRRK